jgi:FkbM family methyltransferase
LSQIATNPPGSPLPADLRRQCVAKEPNSIVSFLDYAIRITDGLTFYNLFKDVFYHRILHFRCLAPDPVILDGGSHIGTSILYFKHLYPRARVIGFEPNPRLFRILQENVKRNGLIDVTLINAALAGQPGTRTFPSESPHNEGSLDGADSILIPQRRLSEFVQEPIDFLKLTVNGDELSVLQELDSGGKLGHIRELVVDYASRRNDEQRLGALLNFLAQHGFRYLIHDYDAETSLATKPPFRIDATTAWHCLVYARRL